MSHKLLLNTVGEERTNGKANSPPWQRRGGRAINKMIRSFEAREGVVRSSQRLSEVEPTTPPAPAKEAARLFLNGRSHPSFAKEGSSPFR